MSDNEPLRLLFVKASLGWQRANGHDVACYHLMKGLADLGANVSIATTSPLEATAVDGVRVNFHGQLKDWAPETLPEGRSGLTRLQERFRSFWGIGREDIEAVRAIARNVRADVVIAFGLPALPYLGGADTGLRVWAMSDEWVYHHLSLVRLTDRSTWVHLKHAAVKGLYERAFAKLVDRIWVVSETDRKAARWFAGMKVADLLQNGVDTDFFSPKAVPERPNTAIFWGRLDFEPNIDAVLWFCENVWPLVRQRVPSAEFTVVGYAPTKALKRVLTAADGVTLVPDVPDLREMVCGHAVVVLPMISGGGIKNKLLEGAAMARPIVCTPRTYRDLRLPDGVPFAGAARPDEFAAALVNLWGDAPLRRHLGQAARTWVQKYHSWLVPARIALTAFEAAVAARRSPSP